MLGVFDRICYFRFRKSLVSETWSAPVVCDPGYISSTSLYYYSNARILESAVVIRRQTINLSLTEIIHVCYELRWIYVLMLQRTAVVDINYT